nr:venom-related protein conodipine [Conus judaeus]DAZ86613.1 TPA_inf: venom-related protein Conodipine [Conus judaeus]
MKMLESALWILAALALPWIVAQDSSTAELCKINSNGCSVPSALIQCRKHFLAACDIHDNCYLCGAHFGLTRNNCDNAFLTHMTALCAQGTDEGGFCLERRKRREASSMFITTTPLRQLRLLEKLMPPNSLSDHDSRQPQQRFFTCTKWAKKYFDAVRTFGSSYFSDTANATYCPQFVDCMPQV